MATTIGRYELLEKIGEGGMGIVHRAFDPLLQRIVAVKIISTVLAPDSEMRERFFREARAAGQLTHKNIIVIYDLGEEDGHPFLAMEYLAGVSLGRRLDIAGRLPLDEALRCIAQACHGLDYAHANGVVHRDIKPANLFITAAGDVKILDFGLARLTSSELTQSAAVMGTASYMAPEQVRGERTDHRADIFAIGAVLYELLAGRKAFHGDSFAATVFKIAHEPVTPLTTVDPAIPREVETIVERALVKRREERYQSVRELLHDLGAVTGTPAAAISTPAINTQVPTFAPASAPPVSSPPSLPWSPRRVRTTGLIGGLLVLSVVGAVLQMRQSSGPPPAVLSTAAPQQAPQKVVEPPSPPPSAAVASLAAAPPITPPAVQRPASPPPTAAEPLRVPSPGEKIAADITASQAAEAKAAAEAAGATTIAAAQYEAAVARDGEARGLYAAGQLSAAATAFTDAAVLFRTAEATARAEHAALDHVAAPAPPVAPQVAKATNLDQPARADAPSIAPQQAIHQVMQTYVGAMQARDLAALHRIWPSLGGAQERALRTEFENARSLEVSLSGERIEVRGDMATARALRQYVLRTADGNRLSTANATTFTLQRSGDSWIITNIAFERP